MISISTFTGVFLIAAGLTTTRAASGIFDMHYFHTSTLSNTDCHHHFASFTHILLLFDASLFTISLCLSSKAIDAAFFVISRSHTHFAYLIDGPRRNRYAASTMIRAPPAMHAGLISAYDEWSLNESDFSDAHDGIFDHLFSRVTLDDDTLASRCFDMIYARKALFK